MHVGSAPIDELLPFPSTNGIFILTLAIYLDLSKSFGLQGILSKCSFHPAAKALGFQLMHAIGYGIKSD